MSDQLDLDFTKHPIIEIKPGEVIAGYIAPIKKRGRPPGSKNKNSRKENIDTHLAHNQKIEGASPSPATNDDRFDKLERSINLLTQIVSGLVDQKKLDAEALADTAKTVQEKLENTNERKVKINVKPEMMINGVRYCGIIEVPFSLSERLKTMMATREEAKRKEMEYIEHPILEIAVLKGG